VNRGVTRVGRPLLGILLLWSFLFPVFAGEEFEISRLQATRGDPDYLMQAEVQYRFSEPVLEALYSGVPLTLELHLQLRRVGAWIWEPDLLDQRLRYRFRYHALAELYQVTDLQSGSHQEFATLEAALAALGKIRNLPLIEAKRLDPQASYRLSLEASLDIESLPLPLRPMAYITPAWNLSSETAEWLLKP